MAVALLALSSIAEMLGEVRTVNAVTTPEQLTDMLGRHRQALLALGGDVQRLHEHQSRMLPEMQAALADSKAGARAEWVPAGDTRDMEARYLELDGTVRFGRSVERVELPNGSVEEIRMEGLLTDPYPVTKEQQAARNAYAGFGLAFMRARRLGVDVWGDDLVRRAFVHFRKTMLTIPGRVGEYIKRAFSDPALRKRIFSGTNGSGGELIAVPTMNDIRRPTDLARRIPGLVRTMPAPAKSFSQPIVTGRALSRKRGATTDDPARYPVQTFTTSSTTLTVVDRVTQALLDGLWIADAAKILGDPMGFVMQWLEAGDIDTLELAFLHGDTNAQDTRSSWTMGGYYSAGDLDGSQTPLGFWIGWRARAADDSCTASAGGTFDAADHFGALALMKNTAEGAVMITGLACLYAQLLPNSLFTGVDKFGQYATMVTGELGRVGKTPLIISEFMANEFASASGLYTGSGTTNSIVYVNPDRYVHYELTDGAESWEAMYPERGANYVGFNRRSVLATDCLATEKPAALLYNL